MHEKRSIGYRFEGLNIQHIWHDHKYSGTEDPVCHLESFVHQMEIQNATRAAMCRMFPSTLTDCARTWFRKLPVGSVHSFTKLTTDFCAQFQGIKPRPKDPVMLQYVIQERGETLKSYVEKFHKEVIQMGVFAKKETVANFRRNLWAGRLFLSFAKHPPETYQEAYDRALEKMEIYE